LLLCLRRKGLHAIWPLKMNWGILRSTQHALRGATHARTTSATIGSRAHLTYILFFAVDAFYAAIWLAEPISLEPQQKGIVQPQSPEPDSPPYRPRGTPASALVRYYQAYSAQSRRYAHSIKGGRHARTLEAHESWTSPSPPTSAFPRMESSSFSLYPCVTSQCNAQSAARHSSNISGCRSARMTRAH